LGRAPYEIQWSQRGEIDVAALQTFVEIRHGGSHPEVEIRLF
jgi:hypothetical protein